MDADQIPTAMVEAAARALHEHDRLDFMDVPWEKLAEVERDSYRKVQRSALAAALSVCEAREQWRRYWPDGSEWDEPAATGWRVRKPLGAFEDGELQRRWVFTTPAEPVPDNGETT